MDRFFQTWYDDRHYWTLYIDSSLNDFDPHWTSQLYENTKPSAQKFLANFVTFLDEMYASATWYFV